MSKLNRGNCLDYIVQQLPGWWKCDQATLSNGTWTLIHYPAVHRLYLFSNGNDDWLEQQLHCCPCCGKETLDAVNRAITHIKGVLNDVTVVA